MSGTEVGPALPFAHFIKTPTADQNTGAVIGTFTTLVFATTDVDNGDQFIDAPTTTQLRALAAGYYRVEYEIYHFNGGNNNARALEARAIVNATTVPPFLRAAGSGNNALNNGGSLFASEPLLLAANDVVEIEASPLQAVVHTVVALYSSFSMELIRLT